MIQYVVIQKRIHRDPFPQERKRLFTNIEKLGNLVTGVRAGNGVTAGRAVGEDGAATIGGHVDDGGAVASVDRAAGAAGSGAREGDGAEVGELDLGAARLESLDDPLGVGLAEGGGGVGEVVADGLASGLVLKGGSTSGGGGGVDGHLDDIANRDGEGVVRVGVVRDPLVPGIEGAIGVEGDTSLEDSSLARVTINTNPGRGSGGRVARDLGDGDDTLDVGPAVALRNGTSPVARVGDVGDGIAVVGDTLVDGTTAAGSRVAGGETLSTAAEDSARSSGSKASSGSEGESVLHIDGCEGFTKSKALMW